MCCSLSNRFSTSIVPEIYRTLTAIELDLLVPFMDQHPNFLSMEAFLPMHDLRSGFLSHAPNMDGATMQK